VPRWVEVAVFAVLPSIVLPVRGEPPSIESSRVVNELIPTPKTYAIKYIFAIGAFCSVRRTSRVPTDVSRRTIIQGAAGLFALSGVGTASAQEEVEDGGEEPTASVTFSDQTVANDGGPTVTVDRLETNEGGYMSIHQYSRFRFADGEDPDDYDVPVPDELGNPICESLIGITEYLEPGVHENLEVPLLRSNSPAVELGAASVGPLEESQAMIAIPHHNTTDEDTFVCPDDPSTPDLFESPEEVDGAFQNGGRAVGGIGVVHNLATVLVEADDQEQRAIAEREEELIRTGVLVPQSIDPNGEDEEDEDQQENEEEAEEEDGADGSDGEDDEEADAEEAESDGDERQEGEEEAEGVDESGADGRDAGDEDDESSGRGSRNELPEQASDRARDAHEDAPGFGG
jgi:hypothetical protein